MLLPLFGLTPKAITVPLPEPPPIVRKVEPTLEEKIKSNFYKCNTDIEWIRADNAKCLVKNPTLASSSNNIAPQAEKPLEPIKNGSNSPNNYEYGQCTWWVKHWKPEVGNWGNANDWGYAAQAAGWTVSSIPVAGAVAWSTRGYYGHVAYVLEVRGSTVVIQEGNYDFKGSVRTIVVPVSEYRYIY